MVENNICTPEVAKRLQENNVKTLETLLFLQGCSTEIVGDTVDYQYDKWDKYPEDVKAIQITDPVETYNQALSNLRGASFTVTKTGKMSTDFINHSDIRFSQEMEITEYDYYTMSGEGTIENITVIKKSPQMSICLPTTKTDGKLPHIRGNRQTKLSLVICLN